MDSPHTSILVLTGLFVSLSMVTALVWDCRNAMRLGRIIERAQPGRGRRHYALTVLILVGAAIHFLDTGVPLSPALQVLVPAAMLIGLSPGLRDSTLAELGVRSGWYVRQYAELEEWRLTGDHLRWKLHGEWQACAVPADQRDELRTKLESLAGDRESRFRH